MDHAQRLAEAVTAYRAARVERDQAIRDARADGMPLRAIAEIVGLSHQRVAQIAGG